MADMTKMLSFENPIFGCYLTYVAALTLKMMFMSIFTGKQRKKYNVVASPEDAVFSKAKVARVSHEDVDRVRRAHLNDLENIPIFIFVGFTYMLTNPSECTAMMLYRVYTAARFIHTFVYAVCVIPQPARGISWGVGFLITGYMAITSLLHFAKF